jgi:hypothetical protein
MDKLINSILEASLDEAETKLQIEVDQLKVGEEKHENKLIS